MPNTDIIFANIRIGSRGTEHLHFDAAFTVTAHRQALTPSATRLLAKLLPTSTVALWLDLQLWLLLGLQGRHPVNLIAVNVPFVANVRLRSEGD